MSEAQSTLIGDSTNRPRMKEARPIFKKGTLGTRALGLRMYYQQP